MGMFIRTIMEAGNEDIGGFFRERFRIRSFDVLFDNFLRPEANKMMGEREE
jgi:hypothetical protein